MPTDNLYRKATHNKREADKLLPTSILIYPQHRAMAREANLNLSICARFGIEQAYKEFIEEREAQTA